MRRPKYYGVCHACLNHRKLSYEHVPPRSAFNDRPVVMEIVDELMLKGEKTRKIHQQKGAGGYTLCSDCNSKTGRWYGGAFAGFTHQGLRFLGITPESRLLHGFYIFPLRVLKQIVCMFLSVNTIEFCRTQEYLREFVLDKEKRYLPPDVKVHVYYAIGNRSRSAALCSILHPLDGSPGSTFTEITWPPFGYALSFGNPPHPSMHCINHWSEARYNDVYTKWIQLPVLPIYGVMPGDYRNESEVLGS